MVLGQLPSRHKCPQPFRHRQSARAPRNAACRRASPARPSTATCRRLLGGRRVTSYEQFCEYLVAKDPQRIRVGTLPFEGRNKVLYRL